MWLKVMISKQLLLVTPEAEEIDLRKAFSEGCEEELGHSNILVDCKEWQAMGRKLNFIGIQLACSYTYF